MQKIVAYMAFISLFLGAPLSAQNPSDIYRVEARGCQVAGDRVQTGFVAEGFDGILTALHGVVGCNGIRARSSQSNFQSLYLSHVDIDRDIALLKSERASQVITPWKTFHLVDPEPSTNVHVWGFPGGISLYEVPLTIPRYKHVRPLAELVPTQQFNQMESRGSPSLHSNVVSVNGNLMPGHSGAPIFSSEDTVVGIANGGFSQGQFGIGWGSLPTHASLVEASTVKKRLHEIASSESLGNFSLVNLDNIPSSGLVEKTSNLALLSPSLYRIWIERPPQNQSDVIINPTIRRTVADLEDNLTLVINKDGKQALGRNVLGEVEYQYYRNWDGTRFVVWLQGFYKGRYVIISNIAHYFMGKDGHLYKQGGPYDETGEFSDQLTLRSKYPKGLNYFSLNYNWKNGSAVIGGASGADFSKARLVVGGDSSNDVLISPIPKNPFKSDKTMYENVGNWYAYLVQETEAGLIPISNIVFRD